VSKSRAKHKSVMTFSESSSRSSPARRASAPEAVCCVYRKLKLFTVVDGISAPGNHVDVTADMAVVISNCPQVNNPCNGFNPTPIRVVVRDAPGLSSIVPATDMTGEGARWVEVLALERLADRAIVCLRVEAIDLLLVRALPIAATNRDSQAVHFVQPNAVHCTGLSVGEDYGLPTSSV